MITGQGYDPVDLRLADGSTTAGRFYPAIRPRGGVLCVGGMGGGWDSPARELYPALCRGMAGRAVHGLRVRFRAPGDLASSVEDVHAGIEFLTRAGAGPVALVGHSFGGAVVLRAASTAPAVQAVVVIAGLSEGPQAVARLSLERCALLLLHGTQDLSLPPDTSLEVCAAAHAGRKELIIYAGADHCLDQIAPEVHDQVHSWLTRRFIQALPRQGERIQPAPASQQRPPARSRAGASRSRPGGARRAG